MERNNRKIKDIGGWVELNKNISINNNKGLPHGALCYSIVFLIYRPPGLLVARPTAFLLAASASSSRVLARVPDMFL